MAYLVFVALHDNRVSGPLNFMPDFQCLNARRNNATMVQFQTDLKRSTNPYDMLLICASDKSDGYDCLTRSGLN